MKLKNIKLHLSLNNSIAIIGAGASGLFASILLAKKGFRVSVYEKNTKAGRKLLATGNGRCNVSNENLSLEYFHSHNYQFFKDAIENFPYEEFEKLVFSFGLDLQSRGTRVYPKSDQASSVVDVLYNEALDNGVQFYFEQEIESIEKKDNFIIKTVDKIYKASKVVIATGSSAMTKLGSSDSGYKLAQNFGHTIIDPIASLVQMESDNSDVKKLSGVKAQANVTLVVNNQKISSKEGDFLFTKYGVSGDTILDLSCEASVELNNYAQVEVIVDLFPKEDKNKLLGLLQRKQNQIAKKKKEFLLLSLIHSKLIDYVFKLAQLDHKLFVQDLNKKDLLNLVHTMKNIRINITKSRGYEYAEVVSGGIDTTLIDSKTFESKKQKGLYCIGEVLDVDGDCGGYNLHFAWASAYNLALHLKPIK